MSIMNRRKEDIMELRDRIKYNVVKDFPNKEVIFCRFYAYIYGHKLNG